MSTVFRYLSPAAALVAASVLLAPAPAEAASFTLEIAGQSVPFEAPAAGGLISSIDPFTVGGVVFDTLGMDQPAPAYDPIENDINGLMGLFGYLQNSMAAPGTCGVLECFLEFEDTAGPAEPKIYAAFPIEMGIPGTVFAVGEYDVLPADPGTPTSPIPLPASGLAGLAALMALAALGAGRRRG